MKLDERGRKAALLLLVVFVASRLFWILVLGLRFDADPLDGYWQVIDRRLLRTDLLRSVWYLHDQPPLFNLGLGLTLKLFPRAHVVVFQGAYLAMGLVMALSLYALMVRLDVRPGIAWTLAALHLLAPATVLYESLLFYTYPATALLCCSALFLHRFLESGRRRDGLICFSLMALVVLVRGLFPFEWFVLFGGTIILLARGLRREALKACAVPLLVLSLFQLKQHVLFGGQAGSSFLWPNLASRFGIAFTPEEHEALRQKAGASGLFMMRAFKTITRYSEFLGPIPATGVPVLDNTHKANGYNNQHHIGYLRLSELYKEDVLRVLKADPVAYLKTLPMGVTYFQPGSQDVEFEKRTNTQRAERAIRLLNLLFCGQLRPNGLGWLLVVGFPLLTVVGLLRLWKLARSAPAQMPATVTLLYVVANILYVTAVAVLISCGDFSRYRFKADPFYVVLLGMTLTSALGAWRPRPAPLEVTPGRGPGG